MATVCSWWLMLNQPINSLLLFRYLDPDLQTLLAEEQSPGNAKFTRLNDAIASLVSIGFVVTGKSLFYFIQCIGRRPTNGKVSWEPVGITYCSGLYAPLTCSILKVLRCQSYHIVCPKSYKF